MTTTPDKPAARPPVSQAERLHRLLRQPQTVRELWLLRELLDRPVSLRRR